MHTFEIKLQISHSIYHDLLGIPAMQKVKTIYRSNYYQKKGILQIELHHHSYTDRRTGLQGNSYYLVLQINANVLLGSDRVFALKLNQFSRQQICNALRHRLYEINEFRKIRLDKLDQKIWITERVDLARDLNVTDPELTSLLCNLGMPYGYHNMQRVPINKPWEILYGESCYFGSKSRRLNFYVKQKALINTKRKCDVDMTDLEHIFRIEIQVLKPGVIYAGRRTATKRSIGLYLDEDYVNNYFLSELEMAFGKERYVSHSIAIKLIDECSESLKEKKKMKEVINLIHKMHGLYELGKALKEGDPALVSKFGNYYTFKRRHLKKIRQLGINPATIPDTYGISELPSLYDLLNAEILCEKDQQMLLGVDTGRIKIG